MTVLFCSKTNQAVTLTVSIAHSGEGEVWRTDRPGVLAKIYHVPKSHEIEKLAQMQERVAKLEVMVKRVPKDPNAHQNHISFAWPQSLLSNNEGEVVGFLMPEVENSLDLLKVCTPRLRKSLKLEISWYFLHVVARNVASIIQAIHYEGYVLGDIKLQNILVNNRALPTIIDTDSFQVIDPFENKIYRCLVGSEGFTPPELISQDIAMVTQSPVHDHFRLGVVIYYLLFSGPPFQGQWIGSGEPPEEAELIRRGLWPFASNSLIQPSKTTIPLNIIHPELERCFLRCFNEGHGMPYKRPTAEVWLKALEVAINDLVSCGKLDSHFYSSIFGRCYWCDRVRDLGVDIFPGNEVTKILNVFSLQNAIQQIGSASSSHSGSPIISTKNASQPKIAVKPKPASVQTPTSPPVKPKIPRRSFLAGLGLGGVTALGWWLKNSKPKPVPLPSISPSPRPSISFLPPFPTITETLPGNIKLEMVTLPGGNFMMGSPDSDPDLSKDETPQHLVKLNSFVIGKYSVTQAQYQAIMGDNPSFFTGNPNNPVECVSWNKAQAFCQKLSQLTGKKYRLPTEAEWEYACRAGTQTRFYFGDDTSQLGDYAWYHGNSDSKTHPVGLKKPNDWGLYDMSGNVWEWCADPWHESYINKPENIKNNGNVIWSSDYELYRVLRGGSWGAYSRGCRLAYRFWADSRIRRGDIGFRLAVSAF